MIAGFSLLDIYSKLLKRVSRCTVNSWQSVYLLNVVEEVFGFFWSVFSLIHMHLLLESNLKGLKNLGYLQVLLLAISIKEKPDFKGFRSVL